MPKLHMEWIADQFLTQRVHKISVAHQLDIGDIPVQNCTSKKLCLSSKLEATIAGCKVPGNNELCQKPYFLTQFLCESAPLTDLGSLGKVWTECTALGTGLTT